MTLTIWAIDATGIRRGILEPVQATAVVRDCDVGTWQIEIDAESHLAKRIQQDWSVVITDGKFRLSGPITSISSEISAGAASLILTGIDEMHRLDDRLVYPNPRKSAPQQDTARYNLKGPAESVIKTLVAVSAADQALPERISPGLVIERTSGRGKNVVMSERFSNVLEVARALARVGGVTFAATREDDGFVHFRVRSPQDLSRQVRFIPETGGGAVGTLAITSAKVTSAIVAGQGEGADRHITERSTSAARRIERLKDRRDTEDIEAIEQAAVELLADGAESAKSNIEISESANRVFCEDFQLGDIVTVKMGSLLVSKPVRSCEIQWDGFGRKVKVFVGDHDQADDNSPAWVKEIKRLQSRVRGLESS